ncbi:MAG TPA: phosphoribosyltransferase family protein [Candidatus Krumholzibacteria bacterium]|nr:phosphoribosyltransferase family protein [Candidatus Krumholzibacteria bacterium]
MRFENREDAARRLVQKLARFRGQHPLVLAIPRGAAIMGRVMADELNGEMDIVLVRKLRAPGQPELAIGAVDEHGHMFLTGYPSDVSDLYLKQEKQTQMEALKRRRAVYGRAAANPRGRVVIVVDDGVATGSTMIAALKSVREAKPAHVIAATAVAPPETVDRLREFADEIVCLSSPGDFRAVGQYFDDFGQVSDDEVVALLKGEVRSFAPAVDPEITIDVRGRRLRGILARPADSKGVVVFAHGSGSSRLSSRNRHVAEVLNQHGIATLLFDLLTPEEGRVHDMRFDVGLLGVRLVEVTEWVADRPDLKGLPIGYFGASTGAAAAMIAAARLGGKIACIVSRGGRPDLAMEVADHVFAPTLLIVGGDDREVLELNRKVYDVIPGVKELSVVRGASHLFEEPGMLDDVARRAVAWFHDHLETPAIIPSSHAHEGGTPHGLVTR